MMIAGNWKMNLERGSAVALAKAVADAVPADGTGPEVVLAPPFPYLEAVVAAVQGSGVLVAAQNCHAAAQGAYTGEVSVPMLRELGVQACIVGHSERRAYFGETDEEVAAKVLALLDAGLRPIYCCGETLAEREADQHFSVVERQMRAALADALQAAPERVVVAYEPVWAIGTGRTATAAQAQEMHAHIRQVLRSMCGDKAAMVPVLYGGSCKPDNAAGIFAGADVDGGLIGGAALEAASFNALVAIARDH